MKHSCVIFNGNTLRRFEAVPPCVYAVCGVQLTSSHTRKQGKASWWNFGDAVLSFNDQPEDDGSPPTFHIRNSAYAFGVLAVHFEGSSLWDQGARPRSREQGDGSPEEVPSVVYLPACGATTKRAPTAAAHVCLTWLLVRLLPPLQT